MAKELVANLYNPHEQSKAQLIASFVARRQVFEKLFRDLKTSPMEYPEQHILIEGQRGSGKTTLLLRLSYAIENDAALNTWLIPVVFKEEAYYGISDLAQLWVVTAQYLEEQDDAFVGLSSQMVETYDNERDDERICFEILVTALESRSKKTVLFIDNFGELLQGFDAFDDRASHRFREVLMTCPHLRVVGATSVTLEAFFHYDHAFYEFFKPVRLKGLNRDEMRGLLLELAKVNDEEHTIRQIIEQQPGRIESLRILTGGVIRTVVLLFEILTDDKDGTSMTDLEHVLDRVTPLYKHRMDDLKPYQRAAVNAIALNWDAMSPEEIARQTRRHVDDIAVILAELEKVFLVQRASSDTQQNFYYLRERFFNIWYLMRVAPNRSQTRVVWLVRFLENWYGSEELDRRARQHIEAVARGHFHPKTAYYLTEALAQTGQLDFETENEMKTVTRELLLEKDQSLALELSQSDQELLEEAYTFHRNKDYNKALACLLKINNRNGYINFGIGVSYDFLKEYEKAEQYYLQAVEHGDTNALNNLGWLYKNEHKDYEKAEQYYLQAVERGDDTNALNNLGVLYENEHKDYEKAEQYYLQAVENGDTNVLNNLGWLYFQQKIKKKEALQYAQRAVKVEKNSDSAHTLSCIYIWHNQIENSLDLAEIFIEDETFYETDEQGVILYLMLLLAKKRYDDVSAYFDIEKINLKERFKPLYYALLFILEDPAYHKLPSELSEPVQDVLARIQQLAVDYA